MKKNAGLLYNVDKKVTPHCKTIGYTELSDTDNSSGL